MFKHLLVPTDGSPLSNDAARSAVDFAKAIGARITTLSVAEPYPYTAVADSGVLPEQESFDEEMLEQARRHVAEVERFASAAGVPCETQVALSEHPFEEIIATAEKLGCDLILMASHGRKGLSRLFVGSQTQKVLGHTTLPVLVYR